MAASDLEETKSKRDHRVATTVTDSLEASTVTLDV
jgi:hypothetical protein